ncbi:MAG: glutamate--tRNA ligase, partial [Gemmatimonadota bacterium]|nr:glutamate--tRNA ligase [Gemmatimonadota bacterium]
MSETVRTRFAPSPTGAATDEGALGLHLGNARTAILNWLAARHAGGAFVLRIEDTDTGRNVEGAEASILEALDWLGLDRDEGPDVGGPLGPYRQSERGDRYEARARELLASGAAFRCFCTPEEIEARRAAAIESGEPPGRDPACRALTDDERARREGEGRSSAVRLRVETGPVPFRDRLKGPLEIDGDDLGDMIIVRADGRPTYNFAVVVDDLEMEITHVIRGVSHLSNTPKQVLLYRALGVAPPEFVHIPQVLAPGGGKLSKRRGAPGVLSYRERGFHPEAVVNYLSLLSWSAPSGEEVFTREELVRELDLDRIGATDAELDEEKMAWLSGQHLRAEPPSTLARRLSDMEVGSTLGLDIEDLTRVAEVFAKRIQLLTEMEDEVTAVFGEPDPTSDRAKEVLGTPTASTALSAAREAWSASSWRVAELKPALQSAGKAAK